MPALYILEVAMTRLWQSFGLKPSALLGHSMGENAAACIAGVMSFEDGLGLVALRGELFEKVPDGGMLSVALAAEDAHPMLGDEVDLATINGPTQCTLSGSIDALTKLEEQLQAADIEFQRIPIAIAAHSRMLDDILPAFREYLEGIELNAPEIPLLFESDRHLDDCRTGTITGILDATPPKHRALC